MYEFNDPFLNAFCSVWIQMKCSVSGELLVYRSWRVPVSVFVAVSSEAWMS